MLRNFSHSNQNTVCSHYHTAFFRLSGFVMMICMNNFKTLADASSGDVFALEDVLHTLKFNSDGLIPAIAQQYDSGNVLMMAWMNLQALEITLIDMQVTYWSRSRQKLWRKGETSGQTQALISLNIDCDGDTLLLQVNQSGPACHTGRESCFFIQADQEQAKILDDPIIDPKDLYKG